MKTTTKAIVLNLSKYSDKASVLHTYSRDYGRMSYMVYGINGKKYRELSAATEPFSLVEIESTASVGRDMPTLSKISFDYVQQNTICDIRKRTVAVFIAEIIYRTMRHPEPDKGLFDFLASTIHELNDTTEPENYHLSFLLRYTYYLGIMPAIDETGVMLDIQTGNMRDRLHNTNEEEIVFLKEETEALAGLNEGRSVKIGRTERQALLDKMCRYYEYHLTDFTRPKSLDILKEVFD